MSTVPLACLLAALLTPLSHQATPQQAPAVRSNETAAQFYLRYRQAALDARSIDQVLAFWTADAVEQFAMEPEAARTQTLGMVKGLYAATTDVRAVQETATPAGAMLSLEGLDRDKKPVTSTVEIVKENGAWKVGPAVEQWRPKRSPIQD